MDACRHRGRSPRPGSSLTWSSDHTLALVLGTVLVGVVMPFWADPYDNTVGARAEFLADLGAGAISLMIVAITLLRKRALAATRIDSSS